MKKPVHHLLTGPALLITPAVWVAVCVVFGYEPISKLLNDWNEHRKSGLPWGCFD